MNGQLDLFGTPEAPANAIEAAFWAFHRENPDIYRLFDKFTRQAIRYGRDSFSAYLIFERIRWETAIVTSGDDFKVNNNFRPYYARLWMRNNPRFEGIFRTRVLRAGPASEELTGRAA